MPYTTPYQKSTTIPNAGAAVNSAAIVIGSPDIAVVPVNIRCPSNLRGVTSVKLQVGYTDQGVTTFFDCTDIKGNVISIILVASSVVPIQDTTQQTTMGFDQIRLVANVNPSADLLLFVQFAAASDDPLVSGDTTIAPSSVIGTPAVASATEANVASSASNVTLLAASATRQGMTVFNESTQVLFIKMGATASATSYTVQVSPGGYWEMPIGGSIYTGIIDGIWASANGNARVTSW